MTTPGTALITGIAGQDGSYLTELLLSKGYRVIGVRRASNPDIERIEHLLDQIELRDADLMSEPQLIGLLESVRPTEVYNLAGHSFVPTSWDKPDDTVIATGLGTIRLLEAIRLVDRSIRFYQASSSEIFGNPRSAPQSETTPPNPRNPYGAAKTFAHFSVANAREYHHLFAVSGILYNHESPRRGPQFLTRKVTDAAAQISLGLAETLSIGSLDAQRDWGFAGDYVDAMWRMLQQNRPSDYVIASGVSHTVRNVCEVAFSHVGLDFEKHLVVDQAFARPPESVALVGDASKARAELGWSPTVDFQQLIEMMVDTDVARYEAQIRSGQRGRPIPIE
jgi:GDPmannose 4,6-dehydratase